MQSSEHHFHRRYNIWIRRCQKHFTNLVKLDRYYKYFQSVVKGVSCSHINAFCANFRAPNVLNDGKRFVGIAFIKKAQLGVDGTCILHLSRLIRTILLGLDYISPALQTFSWFSQ